MRENADQNNSQHGHYLRSEVQRLRNELLNKIFKKTVENVFLKDSMSFITTRFSSIVSFFFFKIKSQHIQIIVCTSIFPLLSYHYPSWNSYFISFNCRCWLHMWMLLLLIMKNKWIMRGFLLWSTMSANPQKQIYYSEKK